VWFALTGAAGCETGGACTVATEIQADGTMCSVLRCPDGSSTPLGATGTSSVVRVDDEPAGEHCARGGAAIHSGADVDGDGLLSDSEITSTSYVCNGGGLITGTLNDSYFISNSVDASFIHEVTRIAGDLTISAPSMTALSLPNLAQIDGSLIITNCPSLAVLELPQLGQVGGGVNILAADALTSLAGLGALTKVDGFFTVASNQSLGTLDGLDALTAVGGALDLRDNPALTSMQGLSALGSVGGPIYLRGNAALTGLSGLAGLTSALSLDISGNAELLSLAGLSGLTALSGELRISENAKLTSLEGLGALTEVGALALGDSGALTSVAGLDGLVATTTVLIERNPVLSSLAALSHLTTATGVFLDDNPQLASLAGLGGLTSLSDALSVKAQPALTTLAGISALTSVRALTLVDNLGLTALGLGELTAVSDDFLVTGNTSLRQCLVDALLAQLTTAPTTVETSANDGVGGCP